MTDRASSRARLQDKVCLITGAGRGLGAAIARRYRDEGAVVLVNDVDGANAESVAQELDARFYVADVSDPGAVRGMFAEALAAAGRIDVVVNNAGISGIEGDDEKSRERQLLSVRQAEEVAAGGPIETHVDVTPTLSDEEWRRMIAVHLDGTFYCCREALAIMNRQGSGSLINMGSIMGTSGGAGAPHYCAAKAGILGLTRALAREGASRGIRVNAIAPGWIDTDMTAPLEIMRPLIVAQTPLQRFGDADDIAWAAVYLASDEAKFVTGQVLSPNGGWHMSQ
ncbi:MAG: SDR family NAD(P)-dependent oxidoreductase [Acidobacteria bacterium]|nr:MAG: SDR family NAD(P)-dependent oxidoreductase [Acidobacteriota bacterium]REK04230.1 MAG: SDR family NAD(P)-dependent oxidoreductase [Acidobacteriota bacterium]